MGVISLLDIFSRTMLIFLSVGEQSVGKSFALNHLADTSFAGSAMRTTEGVWMAVTPTETDLIVALDFEGLSETHRILQSMTENSALYFRRAQHREISSGRHSPCPFQCRDLQLGKCLSKSSEVFIHNLCYRSCFEITLRYLVTSLISSRASNPHLRFLILRQTSLSSSQHS